MSKAATGLRTALARGASGTVIAIAEMQADDIFAELSDEQKVTLSAKLAPEAKAAPSPAPDTYEEPDQTDPNEDEENEKASNKGGSSAAAAPAASAGDSERGRLKAVAKAVEEDGPCKGKADVALAMLADDDFAELSAAAMVKMIGKAGSVSGENADGRAMLDAMRAANPDLGNASGASATPKAEENHGWSKIHDEIRDRRNAR